MAATHDEHFLRVATFLDRYYSKEASDVVAAGDAMEGMMGTKNERIELKASFRHVLEGAYAAGVLCSLVRDSANRHVVDDREARGFLWKVYNRTALDYA